MIFLHAVHQNTDSRHRGAPLFLMGIDVNRSPNTVGHEDDEEEAGVSSPNSTISSVSGKRSERELDPVSGADEHETERASSRGISDEEEGGNLRKKLRLSRDQSAVLEETFREHNTLNPVSDPASFLLRSEIFCRDKSCRPQNTIFSVHVMR